MKLAVNQAYFLPYPGYFQLINAADTFLLYDLVNFRPGTWMTRNRIQNKSTGKAVYVNIPISAKSSNRLIRDVRIAPDAKMEMRKLVKRIRINYGRAQHFKEVISFLEPLLLDNPHATINGFNGALIRGICEFLGISTLIKTDCSVYAPLEKQLRQEEDRQEPAPAMETALPRKTRRILRLCETEGADTYLNLPGGQALYQQSVFKKYNIGLRFVEPTYGAYPQFQQPFLSHLSTVDALMHCGPAGTMDLINNYRII